MQRPFKFRICYTDQNGKKSIIYSDNNRFLIGLNGKVYENYGKDWKDPMWEEVFDSYEPPIIQQYTGLNDSNGKEIYEGDIVKDTWKETQPYSYRPDEEYDCETIFEVKYKDYSFNLERKYSREQTCVDDFHREVIGNIFENPELLK